MLIQNIGSAASAPGSTSNSVPVSVAAPNTQPPPVELPQAAPAKQKTAQPTDAQVKSAEDNINQTMKQNSSNVEFSIDKGTSVIKVVDSSTGELISQFPSKAALAISQMIEQSQPGALVEQKA